MVPRQCREKLRKSVADNQMSGIRLTIHLDCDKKRHHFEHIDGSFSDRLEKRFERLKIGGEAP